MTRNYKKAEIQHYVPQLLLRLHVKDSTAKKGAKQVWCFDKKTDRVFSPNIENILAGSRFYEADVDGKTFSLEESLARLEGEASPILTRIVEARTLAALSEKDRIGIAVFAAIQFIRTQAFREYVVELNKGLAAAFEARGTDLSAIQNFKVMSEEEVKTFSLKMLVDAPRSYAPHFLDKHWYLIEGRSDDPFHLGDHPVVRENELVRAAFGTMGLASPGISIYLPLCPTLCLGMIDPTVVRLLKERYRMAKKKHEKLRKRTAKISHSSGATQHSEVLSENDTMMRELGVHIRALLNGAPTPYTHEVVMRVNSLQMFYATRWVISSCNDFSLPKRMIADNQAFRRGASVEVIGPKSSMTVNRK